MIMPKLRFCKTLSSNLTMSFKNSLCLKKFHSSVNKFQKYENPIWRTINILRDDLKMVTRSERQNNANLVRKFPNYVDVLVIGGGALGTSVAYWLKERTGRHGLQLAVLEKDPTHAKSSAVLSVGGLRQQFSLPENIQMSLFGAEFIRTLTKRFGPQADVSFTPNGYLTLADEELASQLIDNSKLQKELGALNVILSGKELKERFPWMNVDDVKVGCLGLEKEGWFDPWAMLCILKRGAMDVGVQYVTAELTDFVFRKRYDMTIEGVDEGAYEGIDEAIVRLPNGEMKSIQFAICVVACGAETGEVAKLARIGHGNGLLSVPLPIEKRKKLIYCYGCEDDGLGLNIPMIADYIGTYFRRDGLSGSYIGGLIPFYEEQSNSENLVANEDHFKDNVLTRLAHRVPGFSNVKIRSSCTGFCSHNTYDENGIIGPHPYYHNMYIASGFSGHGIQHAPAIGRGIAELILDGDYNTISLTRFGFDRFVVNKPMIEAGIL